MHENLKTAGVTLPDYWDEGKVIKALTTLDTQELYRYFGCTNSSSFTRKMKPHFPNRPEKTSYSKYVRDLVCVPASACVTEIVIDDEVLRSHINDLGLDKRKFEKTLTKEQTDRFYKLQIEALQND